MKRVRREVAVDPAVLETREDGVYNGSPINIFDALMRGIDHDDESLFTKVKEAVQNAMENLSEKDRYCLQAIFTERVTYNELGRRLGYRPQKGGSPQAFRATQRALERLKGYLIQDPNVIAFLEGDDYAD